MEKGRMERKKGCSERQTEREVEERCCEERKGELKGEGVRETENN